jgi:protein phosphatase
MSFKNILNLFRSGTLKIPQIRNHFNKTLLNMSLISDVCKTRVNNQDYADIFIFNDWKLMIVADGVSSSTNSDAASAIAVKMVSHYLMKSKLTEDNMKSELKKAILFANEKILKLNPNNEKAKTTIVATLIYCDKKVVIGWVGDSRAYLINKNEIEQLTRDDSWTNHLIGQGVSENEVKNYDVSHIITQCLGMQDDQLSIHTIMVENIIDKDIFLCSDGFWNYFNENSKVIEVINKNLKFKNLLVELIHEVNLRGGKDNTTIVYYKNELNN